MSGAGLLQVRGLDAGYGHVGVLRGVDLSVPAGTIVALVGSNGAGKSTLLRTVSGLLRPSAGAITFDGQAVAGARPHRIIDLGLLHVAEGRRLFRRQDVHSNLELGLYGTRLDRGEEKRRYDFVYDLFPLLAERPAALAGILSGGQQQMLAIGRALMARPKLMLLDEPSLGLSPILVKEIFAIIRRLNQEQNVTMLLVEQNANMALKTAHYGYVLEVGRIVLEGACAKLVENEDVREFYLGQKETAVRGKKRWKRTKRWR